MRHLYSNAYVRPLFLLTLAFTSLMLLTAPAFSDAGDLKAFPPEEISPWPEGGGSNSSSGGSSSSEAADECDVYKVKINKYDDENIHVIGENVFAGSGATLSCLDKIVDKALDYEGLYNDLIEELHEAIEDGENIGIALPTSKDDVRDLIKVWSKDSPELQSLHDELIDFYKEADDDIAEYMEEVLFDDEEHGYLGLDCKPVNNLSGKDVCEGMLEVRWVLSPISLIWDEEYNINDLAFVNFQLVPGEIGWWYTWKASSKTPLLVFDPEHSGNTTSGAQLFGNYTFGGPKLASLGNSPYSRTASVWKNGYEALATLDHNGDGKLSGNELRPLALWFDDNRDGVSQKGETKTLSEVQVTTLFYKADSKDPDTGDIHASLGYERIIDGKAVTGASFDWFADKARSKFELIGRQMVRGASLSSPDLPIKKNVSAPVGETRSDVAAKKKRFPTVDGVWKWKIDRDRQYGMYKPQGILVFSQKADGTLQGYSYAELPIRNNKKARSMVVRAPLQGQWLRVSDGRTKLVFANKDSSGSSTSSEVFLSADGYSLEGASTASVARSGGRNGNNTSFRYTWKAVRFVPPKK